MLYFHLHGTQLALLQCKGTLQGVLLSKRHRKCLNRRNGIIISPHVSYVSLKRMTKQDAPSTCVKRCKAPYHTGTQCSRGFGIPRAGPSPDQCKRAWERYISIDQGITLRPSRIAKRHWRARRVTFWHPSTGEFEDATRANNRYTSRAPNARPLITFQYTIVSNRLLHFADDKQIYSKLRQGTIL